MRSPLLYNKAHVNGQWVQAESGHTFPVRDPATDEVLGVVPNMDANDTRTAITAADTAQPAWAGLLAQERASMLKRWHSSISEHARTIAELMTRECGKPLVESIAEVKYGASFVEWSAEEARRTYGEIIPTDQSDRRLLVLRQPVGVVAAITPWNFPFSMITRKVAPALAAGCTVVLKPAAETPLTALALAALAHDAGFPPGVLNVITTDNAAEMGLAMTTDARVRKITFTGSTPVGKLLMAQASGTVKRVSLELGGNAPFLVFDDADLESAVDGAVQSKFRNSGQTCVCANRFLIQAGIAERFIEALIRKLEALKVGNGMDADVKVGPLINDKGLRKVERLVADAVLHGAQVRTGGQRSPLGGRFYLPTLMSGVTKDMACFREEIFGPVAPVTVFATEEEGIALANDTPFGLAAYAYTGDLARSWRVSEALEYGMVGLNTGLISTAIAPFGGIKESGIGREGSRHALDEFTELKYVAVSGLGR